MHIFEGCVYPNDTVAQSEEFFFPHRTRNGLAVHATVTARPGHGGPALPSSLCLFLLITTWLQRPDRRHTHIPGRESEGKAFPGAWSAGFCPWHLTGQSVSRDHR